MASEPATDALRTAFRVSDATLRAAIESLPYDMFVVDRGGRYVLQNSICRQRWGDVIGMRPSDVATDPTTLELWERNNARAFAGEIVTGEVGFTHAGKDSHCFNIISPIYDEGQIVGIVAVNIDITDRKKAETALEQVADARRALASRVLAAQEEERRHLSRELHDDVGQLLVVAKMEADWLADRIEDAELREVAQRLSTRNEELLARVRSLSHCLRPRVLDDLGIDCALETLVTELARISTVSFELDAAVCPDLSTEAKTAVYRIAQEALNNLMRHAEASHGWLQLTVSSGVLQLVVADDGVGIDDDTLQGGSLGLVGMRERAAVLGGALTIGPRKGGGTELRLELPIT